MMNYTQWMEQNLPGFERASTAYTAALVNRVKRSCRVWTLIARISLLGLAVLLADVAHSLFDIQTLRTLGSWMLFGFAAAWAVLLGYAAEYFIVTSRIRKLVATSALSDITP
jgi:hypothetical protein